MRDLTGRMIRAAKLDVHAYEEVEHDTGATRQAMLVVVLASVAAGLGVGRASLSAMILGALAGLIGWFVLAYLTYWIGTRLLPEPQTRASHGELLRVIGFAHSPGILRVLGVVPPLREIVFFLTGIWVLVTTVIAVRQALDYHGTLRAVGVCVLGWIVQMVLLSLVLFVLGARPA